MFLFFWTRTQISPRDTLVPVTFQSQGHFSPRDTLVSKTLQSQVHFSPKVTLVPWTLQSQHFSPTTLVPAGLACFGFYSCGCVQGYVQCSILILKPKNWIPKTCTQSGKYYSLYFEGVIAKPRIFYFFRLSGAQSCKVGWDGNFILIQAFEHDNTA